MGKMPPYKGKGHKGGSCVGRKYFGQKVKCIYCIYVLLSIMCDKEWQRSYENPSLPDRHHDSDAWKYWCFLLSCFLRGSEQWRKVARVMREYCKPFNYTKEDYMFAIRAQNKNDLKAWLTGWAKSTYLSQL